MRYSILLLLFCSLGPGMELKASIQPPADPEATARWLTSIFTIKNGRVLVAGKVSEDYLEARLAFAKNTEIRIRSGTPKSIIADQEGLYPLIIGPQENGYGFIMYHPFYDYLDRITGSDGLPDYAPNPKAESMTNKGFRLIAEKLHAHFTKASGSLPLRYRVRDNIGYSSEHYVWKVGPDYVILTAYDGNNSDILKMKITSVASELENIQKMPRTEQNVYEDWGAPMPSLNSGMDRAR